MQRDIIQTLNIFFNKTEKLLQSEKYSKICLYAFIIVFFILIFILNRLYPLFADDWSYSFVYGGNERVKNIKDIFISQYRHYFMWGGRTIVHLIAQFLLFIPPWIADTINSIAYIVFTFVIYKIVRIGETKESPLLFILIQLLLWFLLPAFGEDFLWITGSANYLWGTLLILLFLYPYCKLIFNKNKIQDNNILKAILFFIYGGIAGWTNENTVLAMIIGCISILIWIKISKQNIPYWAIGGIIGALFGYIFMVAAPGNYIRYQIILSVGWNLNPGSGSWDKILVLVQLFFEKIFPILCIFVLLFITYTTFNNSTKQKRQIFTSLLFLILGLIAFSAMSFSPVFPTRVWIGIIVFMIIALLRIIELENRQMILAQFIIAACLLCYYLVTYTQAVIELNKVSTILSEREKVISSNQNKHDLELVADKKIPQLQLFKELIEIPSDRDNWLNRDYSRFHEIKSFKTNETENP